MSQALGFDVYGTLVDPLRVNVHLEPFVGALADEFAARWRQKQLEYAFRRGLMRRYENFDVCTEQALRYTMAALDVDLPAQDQRRILAEYRNLPAFPDVVAGLASLRDQGHTLVAFSNGVEASLRELLEHAGVIEQLADVVSVDDIQTFKPSPDVYTYLAEQLGRPMNETWLISANYWDVSGATAAGLRAAWVRRDPNAVPDPWGIEPDLTVANLQELAERIARET